MPKKVLVEVIRIFSLMTSSLKGSNIWRRQCKNIIKFFTQNDPKSVKIQSSRRYLFALSVGIEALHKMLMKLTPGVNFINILRARFLYECCYGGFF